MIAARLFALGGLALAAAMPASASTAEALAHCTSIDAPTARLACYDAAAGRTPSPTVAIEAPTAPTAAKARPVHSNDPQEFGLTPAQRKVEPSGPESIHARVAGIGGDGAGHAVVTLDNGHMLVAYTAGKMRLHRIRVLVGDQVDMVLDPYGGRARIVRRLT